MTLEQKLERSQKIYKEYMKGEKSPQEISVEHGMSKEFISSYIKRHNLPKSSYVKNSNREDKMAKVYHFWLESDMTMADVCRRFKLDTSTLSQYIRRNNLKKEK